MVGDLLARISSGELAEWQAFFTLEAGDAKPAVPAGQAERTAAMTNDEIAGVLVGVLNVQAGLWAMHIHDGTLTRERATEFLHEIVARFQGHPRSVAAELLLEALTEDADPAAVEMPEWFRGVIDGGRDDPPE